MKNETLNLLLFFRLMKEDMEFYSPLYSIIKFKKVRKFNPMEDDSPEIIECETLAGNVVLFNCEGKPIIYHPSGDMIFETNMGECMLYPKGCRNWKSFLEGVSKEIKKWQKNGCKD